MKKLLKIGLILFGIGVLSGIGTYLYVFHKPHRNIAKEKPAYIVDARSLYDEFSVNEESSYEKYGDQVIEVTGEVIDFSLQPNGATLVYLDPLEGISCSFDSLTVVQENSELEKVEVGKQVTLKGKCDGYDMIMGVVLTRCVVLDIEEPIASLK